MEKKKLLITGASGFLGWNLCSVASSKWEVIGIYNTHKIHLNRVKQKKIDLTNYHDLKKNINNIKPDAIIHTAAESDPNHCEAQPKLSYKINVSASVNIAGLCSDLDIPFVFTSSDLVFNGLQAPYSENAPVNPVNIYGEQKVTAEEKLKEIYSKSIICRMPLMFGFSGNNRQSFAYHMIMSLIKGERIRLFSDEFRTPVDTLSAAKGLLLALHHVTGVIHLGGKTRLSRYEMGQRISRILNIDESQIEPGFQKEANLLAPRPLDIALDSSKAFSLGYTPIDIDAAFRHVLLAMKIDSISKE